MTPIDPRGSPYVNTYHAAKGQYPMPYYQIDYYYLATGMEGHADEQDYGVWFAKDGKEAIELALNNEFPNDIMYGPDNTYSTKEFVRGCLRARKITNPEELR